MPIMDGQEAGNPLLPEKPKRKELSPMSAIVDGQEAGKPLLPEKPKTRGLGEDMVGLGKSINLLLIGEARSGKSATGNSILQRRVFESYCGKYPVTKEVQFGHSEVDGRLIQVVEVPGIGYTARAGATCTQRVADSVNRAIVQTPEGFHAILIVVKFEGPDTEENIKFIDTMIDILGDNFLEYHAILVVTRGDDFAREKEGGTTFQQWCHDQKGRFKSLVQDCKGRVVLFDNVTQNAHQRVKQNIELLELVDRVTANGACYSKKQFDKAKLSQDRQYGELYTETFMQLDLIQQHFARIDHRNSEGELRRAKMLLSRIEEIEQNIQKHDKGSERLAALKSQVQHIRGSMEKEYEEMKSDFLKHQLKTNDEKVESDISMPPEQMSHQQREGGEGQRNQLGNQEYLTKKQMSMRKRRKQHSSRRHAPDQTDSEDNSTGTGCCYKAAVEAADPRNPGQEDDEAPENSDTDDGVTEYDSAIGNFKRLEKLMGNNEIVDVTDKDGHTTLLLAAQEGNVECLRLLLEKGSNVNTRGKDGQTALMLAAQGGYSECIKLLLNTDVNYVNMIARQGGSAVTKAARNGHTECLRQLTDKCEDVELNMKEAMAALSLAVKEKFHDIKLTPVGNVDVFMANAAEEMSLRRDAFRGHYLCLKMLLERNRDSELVDIDSKGVLLLAALYGDTDCIKTLHEGDCFVQDNQALIIASLCGHSECLLYMVRNSRGIYMDGEDRLTVLMATSLGGHYKSLKVLLDKMIDVNGKDLATAVMCTVYMGHSECLKILLDRNATVNAAAKGGNTALMLAALKGNGDCLKILLDMKAKVNLTRADGHTALMLAASMGHEDCVQILLEKGANVNVATRNGYTALLFAAREGHSKCLEILLDHKAYVDATNTDGQTALMWAALHGHLECLKILLDRDAKTNMVSTSGYTALMSSALAGFDECVKILLNSSTDVINLANKDGNTALLLASENGHYECLRMLINSSADINMARNDGFTPLMGLAINGNSQWLQILLAKGADLNMTMENGKTALMLAVQEGQVDCVKTLIENGADPNTSMRNEYTVLMSAAQEGHIGCVKTLLESGADINLTTQDEYTALMFAAQEGHVQCFMVIGEEYVKTIPPYDDDLTGHRAIAGKCFKLLTQNAKAPDLIDEGWNSLLSWVVITGDECIELLIERGVDISVRDKYGNTAIIIAAEMGNGEFLRKLIESGGDVNLSRKNGFTAVMGAASQDNTVCLKMLLENEGSVNELTVSGDTALIFAALRGNFKCLNILLDNGADPNLTSHDRYTALMWAALSGNVMCIQALMDEHPYMLVDSRKKANVNQTLTNGCTALILAAQEGHSECLQSLIENGANINMAMKNGTTALMAAAQAGHAECLVTLIENEAELDMTAEDGSTALMRAAEAGHCQCVKQLVQSNADVIKSRTDGSTALMLARQGGHTICVEILQGNYAYYNTTDIPRAEFNSDEAYCTIRTDFS